MKKEIKNETKKEKIQRMHKPTQLPASQLLAGDHIHFSQLIAEVDYIHFLPSGSRKVFGHFVIDGNHCGYQLLATCTDKVLFTLIP